MHHEVESIRVEAGKLRLTVDGHQIEKPLIEVSRVLALASPEDQNHFEVSPSGYGIHWPTLDEDLSIDGLLGILHQPEDIHESA